MECKLSPTDSGAAPDVLESLYFTRGITPYALTRQAFSPGGSLQPRSRASERRIAYRAPSGRAPERSALKIATTVEVAAYLPDGYDHPFANQLN